MKDIIIDTINDLAVDFLYYDRKEDDELPIGEIEKALASKEISVNKIVETFKTKVEQLLKENK